MDQRGINTGAAVDSETGTGFIFDGLLGANFFVMVFLVDVATLGLGVGLLVAGFFCAAVFPEDCLAAGFLALTMIDSENRVHPIIPAKRQLRTRIPC